MSFTENQQLYYAQHLYTIKNYKEAKELFSKLSESANDKLFKLNADNISSRHNKNDEKRKGHKLI
ncbi:19387_t:CDS:2 [Gigaspora margarita]|uniref:19387_t:CDS:1 n=1 Tax=Gigaspora margarita TaxID=4874 RepID=A0ABN7V9E6_GIGMA|nr:19387_t:CDS:2 [Gigaspora margarita]